MRLLVAALQRTSPGSGQQPEALYDRMLIRPWLDKSSCDKATSAFTLVSQQDESDNPSPPRYRLQATKNINKVAKRYRRDFTARSGLLS